MYRSRNIPWGNCIGFASDNASVMVGQHNSVLSRVRAHSDAVYDMGCICHLVNLVVQAGMKAFPFPVEDMLVDTYFHFHHRYKMKKSYQKYTFI